MALSTVPAVPSLVDLQVDISLHEAPSNVTTPPPQPITDDMMPDYILNRIYSHLSPRAIGNATGVCRRFRECALKHPRYKAVIHTRQIRQRKEDEQRKAVERARQIEKIKRSTKKLQRITAFFLGRDKERFAVLCFVLFTTFITLKVNQTIDWPWVAVFVPLWPVFYIIASTALAYDIATSHYGPFSTFKQPHYSAHFFFEDYFESPTNLTAPARVRWRVMLYTPIAATLLFSILLLLHLSGVKAIGSWLVMLPLLLLTLFLSLVVLPQIKKNPFYVSAATLFFFSLLNISFQLDGHQTSWTIAFIPLLILTGLTILVAPCLSRDVFILALFWFILALLLVFEVLLVLYLDHHFHGAALVAIPLFLLEILGIVLCFCGPVLKCILYFCGPVLKGISYLTR